MRREVGFWLIVYGAMGLFIALSVLTILLSGWGVPTPLFMAIGAAVIVGYVFSVWRTFLK